MVDKEQHKVTIVVPVYGDWPSLKDCIESLKKHVDTATHQVMLVNDCGPEVDMIEKNIKERIKGVKRFHYYRNPENLGFVGNCNRAVLELDETDNDILLLNSDTIVTEGFLEEMVAALYSADSIGAVSPRSNNATIATIPLSAIQQKGVEPDESYKIYRKMKPKLPKSTVVPTAHGFCMLIRRELVNKFGLFDTAFGKGYGEEVDFCQRIQAKGYKCLLANRAFVFHMEARSFTPETKLKLLEENNKILRKRYPDYQQRVRSYMEEGLIREGKIEKSAGLGGSLSLKGAFKDFVKRNKVLSSIAIRARRLFKR